MHRLLTLIVILFPGFLQAACYTVLKNDNSIAYSNVKPPISMAGGNFRERLKPRFGDAHLVVNNGPCDTIIGLNKSELHELISNADGSSAPSIGEYFQTASRQSSVAGGGRQLFNESGETPSNSPNPYKLSSNKCAFYDCRDDPYTAGLIAFTRKNKVDGMSESQGGGGMDVQGTFLTIRDSKTLKVKSITPYP